MPDISIVICTLRRPQQLKEAVLSCLALRSINRYVPEIIVVDNSPEAEAADLVKTLAAAASPGTIRYVHEPRTNIAHARNTGIAASRAPLVAFVDDDMRLSSQWLCRVMHTMSAESVDALVGAIEPIVEPPDQPGDPAILSFYSRDLKLPEGSPFRSTRSGYISGVGTGNSVFRRARCFIYPEPFDPAFGVGGGEDTDFFLRLGQRKAKVVWSAQSLAYEFVSPERATLSFVAHRTRRGSQNYARAMVKNSRRRLLTVMSLTGIGSVQGVGHAARYIMLRLMRSEAAKYARVFAIGAFGKIPWLSQRHSWWELTR